MKKKVLLLAAATIMAIGLIGCGSSSDDVTINPADVNTEGTTSTEEVKKDETIAEELTRIVNVEIPAIEAERNSAVDVYNSYFAEDSAHDTDAWLTKLKDEALVDYEVYLYNLQAIEESIVHQEVKDCIHLYVACAQYQFQAMTNVKDAIENKDVAFSDAAQTSINESETYLELYKVTLYNLCLENNITLTLPAEETQTPENPGIFDPRQDADYVQDTATDGNTQSAGE